MRGTTIKRGGTWSAVFYMGKAENGKWKRAWKSGFSTKREAEAFLAEKIGQVNAGTYAPPSKQTVREYLDEWLAGMRGRVRPTTFSKYARDMRTHVLPRIGDLPLRMLTAKRLEGLYADLLDRLSARSVRHVHACLRLALSEAEIPSNPAAKAKLPKVEENKMQTWSREELSAFLAHVREDRLYPFYLLLSMTGMRRGEALGLKWGAVDLDGRKLQVREILTTVDNKPVFGSPKTKNSAREISLGPDTVAALRAHHKRQLEERMKLGLGGLGRESLVFAREDGAPLHPDLVLRAFQAHAAAAGVPVIRLHDLRHTYATLALERRVHPKLVSARLGHSKISITLDLYSHALPGMDQDEAEASEGYILAT